MMTTLPLRRATTTRNERGASAVEYALLLSLIAVIIIVGASYLGTRTSAMYDRPCDELAAVGKPC
jgi:Flp pilus assembly pilin Flp